MKIGSRIINLRRTSGPSSNKLKVDNIVDRRRKSCIFRKIAFVFNILFSNNWKTIDLGACLKRTRGFKTEKLRYRIAS